MAGSFPSVGEPFFRPLYFAHENFEIGRILHLKSDIRNLKLDEKRRPDFVQFAISDFGFEVQDSSNFEIFLRGVLLSTTRFVVYNGCPGFF
jgi:hypothetical protein